MDHNEIYLLVLGFIALMAAGLIIFTVNKTSTYRDDISKHQQRSSKKGCYDES
ncbi:hypothetical protein [Alkalimarinus coralli]|uniref:hypothetical protein n=1 Tax=Alkalimarinus coralli TaxID=2935863 RepID=UPI00202AD159|nr:hypothetical protein [Alkalimarinus coralli]